MINWTLEVEDVGPVDDMMATDCSRYSIPRGIE